MPVQPRATIGTLFDRPLTAVTRGSVLSRVCGLLSLEANPALMPQRSRRPPLLSRLPVWFWVVLLCALVAGLVFKLRHVLF